MNFIEKLKVIMSDIWDFMEPFVKLFMSEAGRILAAIAMDIVTELATSMAGSDGEAKRTEAFKRIRTELATRGISLGVSVINAAIEAAVQRIK